MEKDKQVEELEWELHKLQQAYDDLEEKYRKQTLLLEKAEHRIQNELEPRIHNENRSYDIYVKNGGSDVCTRNILMSNCGPDCEKYGKEGCEA